MRTVHFNERVGNLSVNDRIYTDTILPCDRIIADDFVSAGKLVPQISTINGILYYVRPDAAVMSRMPSKIRYDKRNAGENEIELELSLLD